MRSLPRLFKRYDDLQVVVAGADRRAYSYDAPTHEGSWKNHLLAELKIRYRTTDYSLQDC